jgi:energy-coupling factor transport system permease protein
MKKRSKRHPATWILWSICASLVALLTRNPWYLLCLGMVSMLVRWRASGIRPDGFFLRLYLSLLFFPALLNFIFSRTGTTILLEFPIRWIGGPYTLEGLVFGVSAGIQIAGLLAVMMIFSELVSAQDLLRRTPSALYSVGVTASIALTFVPHVRRSYEMLQEAQQVRGYVPRGVRDLPRVVTPLVILSLERALAIAESLASRGWARGAWGGWRRRLVILGLIGAAVALGLWVLIPTLTKLAGLLFVISCFTLWLGLGVQDGRNRYRPDIWRRSDTLVAAFSFASLTVFVLPLSTGDLAVMQLADPCCCFPSKFSHVGGRS